MRLRLWQDVEMEEAEEEAEEEVEEEADNAEEEEEAESSSAPASTSHHAAVNPERLALMGSLASTPSQTSKTAPTPTPTPNPIAPIIQPDIPPAELIADTGRLFVKNLTFSCTMEDLHKLFQKFGPLSEVHIPIDKLTKKPKGYAFILFLLPEHAVNAYTALDGSIFQGRILEILPGKEKLRAPDEEDGGDGEGGSYKKKREKMRKQEAGNEFSWNSLFMNVSFPKGSTFWISQRY